MTGEWMCGDGCSSESAQIQIVRRPLLLPLREPLAPVVRCNPKSHCACWRGRREEARSNAVEQRGVVALSRSSIAVEERLP